MLFLFALKKLQWTLYKEQNCLGLCGVSAWPSELYISYFILLCCFKLCKIREAWRRACYSYNLRTEFKGISWLKSRREQLLKAGISYLQSVPHHVNIALNRAGVAGVADLPWAASLAEPRSMRALLSECVIPVFQDPLWLLPSNDYASRVYLRMGA